MNKKLFDMAFAAASNAMCLILIFVWEQLCSLRAAKFIQAVMSKTQASA